MNKEQILLEEWKNVIREVVKENNLSAEISWDTSRKDAKTRFLAILRIGKYAEMVVSDPFSPSDGILKYPLQWRTQTENAINKIARKLLQDYSNETIRRQRS